MIKVKKFLCCLKLETGGLVAGWTSLILNFLFLIFFSACLAVLVGSDCDDLKERLINYSKEYDFSPPAEDFDKTCPRARVFYICGGIVLVLVELGATFFAYLLIRGTIARDHLRVKPMMIVFAIVTILALVLAAWILTLQSIVSGSLYALVYGYLFVVVYSMYDMFRGEYERGFHAQYHQPADKV